MLTRENLTHVAITYGPNALRVIILVAALVLSTGTAAAESCGTCLSAARLLH